MMVAELEKEVKAIESELKTEMLERNVEELTVDIFTIRYKRVETSRIDVKAIRNEMPAIAEQFTKKAFP